MSELILALSVMFVTAGVLLLVANHFGLSPIPFYIIAGLIAGVFVDQGALIDLAQWGIAFLVFVFGIQVNFGALQSVLRDGEVAAATQLIVVAPIAFVIGWAFGYALGFENVVLNAVYFATAATLSSTIIGAGLLEREIRDNLVHGRLASAVHFFDDLVAIALVVILSAEVFTATQITSKIGYAVLLLIAALVIYRHGFPLLIRLADGFEELILMGSISILIAFMAAAEAAGVSIVVGAFAAGIAIRSDGAQALGVRNGIESIKDFFVAIFFVTVGALVLVGPLAAEQFLEVTLLAGTLVLLVVVVNPIVIMAAFASEGYDMRTAFLTSTSLDQVSEFALIIAIQALLLETIEGPIFDAIILAAAITMILSSFTRRHEDQLYNTLVEPFVGQRRTTKIDERSQVDDELTDHVVIVGYGRQGRRAVEALEQLEQSYVVIENDPYLWDGLRAECRNYVLGDAMTDYPWERAHADDARLVVSTVDDERVSTTILGRSSPADVVCRAGSATTAQQLLEQGATYVSVPNVLAGDQLVDIVAGVLENPEDRSALKREHLDMLHELERYGFATRFDR